ncbi:MAG: hypothetical protein ACI8P9_001680 [Parasphingorhabdus sp.]|jgi:hypothetical protein
MDKIKLQALKEQLLAAIAEIDKTLDSIDVDSGPVPPVDITTPESATPDWECYLNRYSDVRAIVQGKPRNEKEHFARKHFSQFGNAEGRKWGCQSEANNSGLNSVASLHGGFLWKPVADSRGGVPVLLTPKSWDREVVELQKADGSTIPTNIEYRGRTNSNRETYFFKGILARNLALNTILKIGDKLFVIPDPSIRYE